ncbi:MAG: hypothetical protein AAB116_04350 [Candidatus Poribacteria bacterium]
MYLFDRILNKMDFFEYLNHVLAFQINDLKRSIEFAQANFLVAIGCMNTIEFLGGLRNGELGMRDKSKSRFKEGVLLLGTDYGVKFVIPNMTSVDEDVMWTLRNGLTHQYLPRVNQVGFVWIGAGKAPYRPFGMIERRNDTSYIERPTLMLDVSALVEAIENGCETLFVELKKDEYKKARAEKALSLIPELL